MPSLFLPSNASERNRYAAMTRNGQLRRIRNGVYTDATEDQIPALVEAECLRLVAYLVGDAVLSHRSAVELRPHNGRLYVTADTKSRRYVNVGNTLTIDVMPGNTTEHVHRILSVSMSDTVRQLLENLTPSRSRKGGSKSLGRDWVEQKLVQELSQGEDHLNRLRDEARQAAPTLGLTDEFDELSEIISALLNTHSDPDSLKTSLARAQARREPYDDQRRQAFEKLASYLVRITLTPTPFQYQKAAWRNLSFFEAYFSNYIEGTEFLVEEAERIVFNQEIIENRSADSHDILSVYEMVHDYSEMTEVPDTAREFLDMLQDRHRRTMRQRPDKNPGVFKTKINRAGNTQFVAPDHLIGTLTQGFDIYQDLPPGFARALFMQFLISECHPFDDGNGRLSRVFLNAELARENLCKIIVPTVSRDNYLTALRRATRDQQFRLLVKVFWQLQHYTAAIDWADYDEALMTLEDHRATVTADEGLGYFNRHLPKLASKDLPSN